MTRIRLSIVLPAPAAGSQARDWRVGPVESLAAITPESRAIG